MSDSDQSIFAVLLMGPTAAGKTALTFELAKHFPIEIVSVDSALVYQEMDIGTAKPSKEEMAVCPHHLINIISPEQTYSAADFHRDATQLVKDIHARGHLPVLAGGTMMYYKALRDGLSDLPQADQTIRAQIDQEAIEHGWPSIHAKLAIVDPETAARLAPNDSQRLQRAWEIYLLTGKPMSSLIGKETTQSSEFDFLPLALLPEDRSWLHERIALRFHQMLEQGFLDEVAAIRARYPDLHLNLPSMRCVGYRQAWEYQDGLYDYKTFVEKGIVATRQLAKRQITWLRSMEKMVLNCQSNDYPKEAVCLIQEHLARKMV